MAIRIPTIGVRNMRAPSWLVLEARRWYARVGGKVEDLVRAGSGYTRPAREETDPKGGCFLDAGAGATPARGERRGAMRPFLPERRGPRLAAVTALTSR